MALAPTREELLQLPVERLVDLVLEAQGGSATLKRPREPDATPNPRPSKKAKRGQRPLVWARWSVRHVALRVAYVGWDYHGMQRVPGVRTVEGALWDALQHTKLVPEDATPLSVRFQRCGRTDTGVSAFGQVVSLLLRSNVEGGLGVERVRSEWAPGAAPDPAAPEIDYVGLLNRVLPHDIRITAWAPVAPEFSARFSTLTRTYKYLFVRGEHNVAAMERAAQHFVGEHDFRNFCKLDLSARHFRRTVHRISIAPYTDPALSVITIEGTAFLWHQVRCMVAVLFMVGRGLEDAAVVPWLLDIDACPRKPVYNMASEVGLVLYDATHRDVEWQPAPGTRGVHDVVQRAAHDAAVRCAMRALLAHTLGAPAPHTPPHRPLRQRDTERSVDERLAAARAADAADAAGGDNGGGDD